MDIRLVLGETATALVGGILYASIMVYNGIWDKCLPKSATIWRDFFTSVIFEMCIRDRIIPVTR